MRIIRPWLIPQWLYPRAVKRIKTEANLLFLTFDDGPDKESTPSILEILARHKVPAVFFCSGRKAENAPDLIESIKYQAHVIGNHGYEHLDGWRTRNSRYFSDIHKASEFTSTRVFRPPFGRISPYQFRILRNKYIIFFWDLMPYDFDRNLSPDRCLDILCRNLRPGSVIALHDTPGSSVHVFLERFILRAHHEGYSFSLPGFLH